MDRRGFVKRVVAVVAGAVGLKVFGKEAAVVEELAGQTTTVTKHSKPGTWCGDQHIGVAKSISTDPRTGIVTVQVNGQPLKDVRSLVWHTGAQCNG